ncbi:MAG TPA: helix-turn-helix domain-containing protein [Actinomycetes bacterium]|nr:helix-turn-helix domain-containing protein [Actinomycetes bacterium]
MSIGAEVLAAREEAGLSLAEVSSRTRIRATVIGEIESDNFAHCGGDIYARGHLRAIATAVGVDPQPGVDAYDAEYGTVAPSATEVFDSETSATPVRRKGANWSAVMAAALVVAVGLVAVQIASSSDDGSRTTTTVAEPTPTPTSSETGATPTDKPSQVAKAERDEVVVRVTALPAAISWVQVTASDGSVVFTGQIGGGTSKTFRDKNRLSLVIGNAAAVELTVNGQDLGSPGESGQVARLKFTPKDPDGTSG